MLSRTDFARFAEERRPEDIDEETWASAVRVTLAARRDDHFAQADLATVREVADAMTPQDRTAPRPVPLERTALTEADAGAMMAVIDPAIRHARQQAFGAARAPFRSPDRAVSWLRSAAVAKGGLLTAIEAEARGREGVQAARQEGFRVEVWGTGPRLRWNDDPDGETLSFRPCTDKALFLAHTLRVLSDATGFTESDLLRYALLGGDPPQLVRAMLQPRTESHMVALPDGKCFGFVRRSEVVVRMLAPDLSEAELRTIVRAARTELYGGARRRPKVEERDLRLAQLVEASDAWSDEKGVKYSMPVWEKIAKQWKKETGKKVGARTLLGRFRRLDEKRKRLSIGAIVRAEESWTEPWRTNDG